jgi:hypothetical protein
MSGKIDSRLRRLETISAPKDNRRAHLIIGGTFTIGDDDGKARAEAIGEARQAELIREGVASAEDVFIIRLIVRPRPRLDEGQMRIAHT